MEKKHLCYLVAFVLFASCSSNESKNSTLKNICKINIDNIQKKDTIFLSNYFKKVKFIELETTDESLIGSFDGMIIHND
ncbi:MAG: 6-bladed beta-propeller, partial [Dysgonamonadaceae bacterium]|nr:6-bladed beta-propeller [Dysgonamonadaceae bacterium]